MNICYSFMQITFIFPYVCMSMCVCTWVHASAGTHIYVCKHVKAQGWYWVSFVFLVEYGSMIVASLLALCVICVCLPYIRITFWCATMTT